MQFEMEPSTFTFDFLMVAKLILIAVLTYYLYFWIKWRNYNLPPGPWNFPVLGCFPLMNHRKPYETFSNWARQYGKIFYCRLGGDPAVVLNDAVLIKEVFSEEHFQDRPKNPWVELRKAESGHAGIVFSSGLEWKEHRRFILRTFKDFGVGKERNEEKIAEEVKSLIEAFHDTKGRPFDNKIPISLGVANVMSNILCNKRHAADDSEFIAILTAISSVFKTSFVQAMINSYRFVRYFPPFSGLWKRFSECIMRIAEYFARETEEHFEKWNGNQELDLIDTYIAALKTKNSDHNTTFAPKQLAFLVEDLMEAGYETTSTSLRWAFLLMAAHPEIQRRVQEELDTNIPAGSLARPADRRNLPYTEAVIAEMHRFASVVPFGVVHVATVDSKILSYDIPKGTLILPNQYFVHHDETFWHEPYVFNPNRFLSSSAYLDRMPESYMPFLVGKRRCPGENLAQDEVFMFFTGIMKNFTLSLPDGPPADFTPVPGPTIDTSPHCIIAIQRRP